MQTSSIRKLVLACVPLSFATAISCDDLSDSDKEKVKEQIREQAQEYANQWIDETFGSEAPPDKCEGSTTCHGPAPDFQELQCHECEEICRGSGDKESWATSGQDGCEQLIDHEKFLFKVKLSGLGSVAEAEASTETTADIWTESIRKVKAVDPEDDPMGEDPETFVTWRAFFKWEMSFSQTVKVTWQAGSAELEITWEKQNGSVARCAFSDLGGTCGGDDTGTTGGGDTGDSADAGDTGDTGGASMSTSTSSTSTSSTSTSGTSTSGTSTSGTSTSGTSTSTTG